MFHMNDLFKALENMDNRSIAYRNIEHLIDLDTTFNDVQNMVDGEITKEYFDYQSQLHAV